MSRSLSRLAVALAAALCACATAPRSTTPPLPPLLEDGALAKLTLPSVVLLVAEQPDGTQRRGAGVLLEQQGLALTSLRLVAGAVRVSGALQGGAPVNAALVRGDFDLELAVVRLEADTRAVPKLAWRDAPAQEGERVLALGHSAEAPWASVASTVRAVSAHAIETSAATFDSGALVDARGRIIALVTAQGARPIFEAKGLVDAAAAPFVLDRATPESAARTCLRARELGSPSRYECVDVEGALAVMVEARQVALGRLSEERRREVEPTLPALTEEMVALRLRSETVKKSPVASANSALSEVEGRGRTVGPSTPLRDELVAGAFLHTLSGMSEGLRAGVEGRLRLTSVTIDRVRRVGEDRAWLELRGRDADGAPFRASELWVKRGAGWVARQAPAPDELTTKPDDFPAPLITREELVEALAADALR